MTLWSEREIRDGAIQVCNARNRHINAYRKFQFAYDKLAKIIEADNRVNLVAQADQLKLFVRSCIDHKIYLTTGGHNIMMDIIPNEAAAACLNLGSELLTSETGRIARVGVERW